MKKRVFIFLGFLIILSGCQSESKKEIKQYEKKETDVYSVHGNTEGIEFFEKFMEDVENGKDSEVRVVRVTIEGDPIIWDIKHKNGEFAAKYDTSYDGYGYPSIKEFKCEELVGEELNNESEKEMEYKFKSCEGHSEDIYIFNVREKKEEEQYITVDKNLDDESEDEKQKEVVDLESVNEIKIILKEINWKAKKVQMSRKYDFEIVMEYKDKTIKAIPDMYKLWISEDEEKMEIVRDFSEEMYGEVSGEKAKRIIELLKIKK